MQSFKIFDVWSPDQNPIIILTFLLNMFFTGFGNVRIQISGWNFLLRPNLILKSAVWLSLTWWRLVSMGICPFQHHLTGFQEKQHKCSKREKVWQLLSIKENICPERPRKSHALQDGKKYFFLYTTRKMRSTAFQPCITLGGLHWDEMGQKNDFLKKNALKTVFLGDTILDRLTSEGVGTQFF